MPVAERGCPILRDYRERSPENGPAARVGLLQEDSAARAEATNMKYVSELKVKIFADGADKAAMLQLYAQPYIRGFTTNPTLMRKAGIADYEAFARDILEAI